MTSILRTPAGTVFSRWTVIETPYRDGRYTMAACRCACGTERLVNLQNVAAGLSRSCGCLDSETTAARNFRHGASVRGARDRLYTTWAGMKSRCQDPSNVVYEYYGARGITVCVKWQDFIAFRDWALATGYNDDLTIERKNVALGYKPSNCKWIPRTKQSRNRRDTHFVTAFGETKGIADWLDDPRCRTTSRTTLIGRLNGGWPPERALSSPKSHRWSRRPRTDA
jgi:hypothetical protein